jgi:hypothetical protein
MTQSITVQSGIDPVLGSMAAEDAGISQINHVQLQSIGQSGLCRSSSKCAVQSSTTETMGKFSLPDQFRFNLNCRHFFPSPEMALR